MAAPALQLQLLQTAEQKQAGCGPVYERETDRRRPWGSEAETHVLRDVPRACVHVDVGARAHVQVEQRKDPLSGQRKDLQCSAVAFR